MRGMLRRPVDTFVSTRSTPEIILEAFPSIISLMRAFAQVIIIHQAIYKQAMPALLSRRGADKETHEYRSIFEERWGSCNDCEVNTD